jgi:hypothetical protein
MFSISAFLALAGIALAQTPTGFTPNTTAHLDVKFGSTDVTPGLALAKSGA